MIAEAVHEAFPVEALARAKKQVHHVAAVVALALHDVRLRPDHLLGRREPHGDAEDFPFDGVLERYAREGVIKKEDALAYASNPGNFLLRLSDMGAAGPMPPPGGGGGNSMLDMIE